MGEVYRMNSKRIIIISGSPGSGKSSVSLRLAECSASEFVIRMHTDDFYSYIRKGYISPWLSEASEQNTVIIESFVASVERLASGGYEVIVDGVLGPWFLEPWFKLAQDGFDVRYIILRPSEQIAVSRATKRKEGLKDVDAIKHMWQCFSDLELYEPYAIDTSNQNIEETVSLIQKLLEENVMRIV